MRTHSPSAHTAASGVLPPIIWLQRALGVAVDGALGSVKLAAARGANPDKLKAHLLSKRLRLMAGLLNWPSFSRCWSRRVADLPVEGADALDPVTAMLETGGKVIDKLWPDPARAAQANPQLIELHESVAVAQIAGQLEIHNSESESPNRFTSGWGSLIG